MTVTAHDPQSVLAALESSDRFLIQQVFKPIANEYRISIPAEGSTEEGEPLLYVRQKKLKIKEDIRFRLSPDDGRHLFMIKSKTVFEFRGRHEVLDELDQPIGLLEKVFGLSLLRSHWRVRDTDGNELLEAHEASWIVALIRRFADFGPDWLSLLTWLPFNFVLKRNGEQIGTYKRVLGKLRDRYVLELAVDQGTERPLHVLERAEPVQALAALLQLAERLRPAEHQRRQERELGIREVERLVEEVPVLDRPASGTAREPHPALPGESLERRPDRRLVVLDDRVAVRGLVASEPQRVQRERVDIGRRPLLLDQAAEDADLDGVGCHAPIQAPYGWSLGASAISAPAAAARAWCASTSSTYTHTSEVRPTCFRLR